MAVVSTCACCTTPRQLLRSNGSIGIAKCTGCNRQVCGKPNWENKEERIVKEGFCDGLIHMGCKQNILKGKYVKQMIPIKLCRTCREERNARPDSAEEEPQHFYFVENRRRRLTNQALIDRFIRESIRCQNA